MTKKIEFFRNMGKYKNWKPNFFVQKIKQAYYSNGFTDAFVESSGRKGIGKTAFSLLCGYQVYGDWDMALDHLFFTPKLALESLRERLLVAKEKKCPVKRVPYLIIDDATMSLNKSRWFLPGIQDFSEYYSLIRTCCASVLFTGPSLRLPESIACDIEFKIVIKPLASQKMIQEVTEGDYKKTAFWKEQTQRAVDMGIKKKYLWRQARIYSNFTIPSSTKRFISPDIKTSIFPLHYPDTVYKAYDIRRNEKTSEMMDRAIDGEKPKKIGRPPNSDFVHKTVRDRYLEHKRKGYSQQKSADTMEISKDMLRHHITEANNKDKTK